MVSIVVATRDRLEHLKSAIASVQAQTVGSWELIVVDDASTDGTDAWLSALADPRVHHLRLDDHLERSAARNRGIARSRGRYLLFMDDDDVLLPRAIELLLREAARRPDAVAIVGGYTISDVSGNRRRAAHPRRRTVRPHWKDAIFGGGVDHNFMGRAIVDAAHVRAAGGFPEELTFGEDFALWLRLTRAGSVASIPDVVFDYRVSARALSARAARASIDSILDVHAAELSAGEQHVLARIRRVRSSYADGSDRLRSFDARDAFRAFVDAIAAAPEMLRSPFTRPYLLRGAMKAAIGAVVGRRGWSAIRTAASSLRRATGRDAWSSVRFGRADEDRDASSPRRRGPDDVTRSVLPIDLAFHYLGCAVRHEDGRIGVPSRIGPLLKSLSDRVERLSVVAYQPTPAPSFEDGVEYTIDAGNVTLVALGPKGGRSDYLDRRRRVRAVVGEASTEWDVILHYLHNRRVHLVHKASSCPRVTGFVVGTTERPAHPPATPLRERILSRLNGIWTERQMNDVLGRARLGVVNSDELLPEVAAIPHVRKVYLSTRPERFTYRTDDRFSSDTVDLLVAGRLELEKGVHDALDAFQMLRHDLPNAVLHFAGDGAERPALEGRVRSLGLGDAVVFHGWIPADERLYELYRRMDVLLLPSFAAYEGFPCVVWEAMAHSVLVVSTQVRGLRTELAHEEELLFVPARDPRAMADAVRRLASETELRRRLIAAAFTKAQGTSVECMASTIMDGVATAWPELNRVL